MTIALSALPPGPCPPAAEALRAGVHPAAEALRAGAPNAGREETIRVLQVVRPAAGGIRQHVLELLRRVDPVRFSLAVAGPWEFLQGLPPDLAARGRVLVEIKPRLSPAADLLAAARLAQYAGRHTDVVHAHGLRAAFVAALAHRLRPFPLVVTLHNLVPPSRLTRLALCLIGPRTTCLIAVSPAIAAGLSAEEMPMSKVSVIPNGVDTVQFHPSPTPAGPDGNATRFTVGCVARLAPEKGVDILVQAARTLPDVTFEVAGEGPERNRLAAIAPPNVRWLGRVEDVRKIYRAADAIAVPSRLEGQGLVALEAMASGVPIVASRVGGLAEMLADGETALLVPSDNADALADALKRLQNDPALRERLAHQGRALVQSRYEISSMIARVESIYATAASGGATPSTPSD